MTKDSLNLHLSTQSGQKHCLTSSCIDHTDAWASGIFSHQTKVAHTSWQVQTCWQSYKRLSGTRPNEEDMESVSNSSKKRLQGSFAARRCVFGLLWRSLQRMNVRCHGWPFPNTCHLPWQSHQRSQQGGSGRSRAGSYKLPKPNKFTAGLLLQSLIIRHDELLGISVAHMLGKRARERERERRRSLDLNCACKQSNLQLEPRSAWVSASTLPPPKKI